MRDNQRQRVYDAERALYPNGEPIMTKQDGRRFFKRVQKALEIPELALVWRRGGKNSYYRTGRNTICVLHANKASILHEIAHHVIYVRYGTKVAPHGPEFAGVLASMLILFGGQRPTDVQHSFREVT